jgi:hypothetical protein
MKQFIALAAYFCIAIGIARADTPLAPSAVIAAAMTYDGQTVTVSGTVKNVQTKNSWRGGKTTLYQLCDSQCVNVVQHGSATLTEGQTQAVTGKFSALVEQGRFKVQNVITVGH